MQTYQYFAIGSTIVSILTSVGASVFVVGRYLGRHEVRSKSLEDGQTECKTDRKKIRNEMYERLYDTDGKPRFVHKDDLEKRLELLHEPIMREVTATNREVGSLRKEMGEFIKTVNGAVQRLARIEGAREAEKQHE